MSEKESEYISVHVTAPNRTVAESLARHGVERRLAACANIVGGVRSLYHWKGAIEVGDECLIVFKTRRALFGELSAQIAAHHPYETPCIVALPIVAGNTSYLQWISDETAFLGDS